MKQIHMINQEMSFLVTSDPESGASNVSKDGSAFEVQLDDGIKIPKDAFNVNLDVEQSTIWWVIPNIIENVNDKLYISGPQKSDVQDQTQLGFPVSTNWSLTEVGGIIELDFVDVNNTMPLGVFQVGDRFRPDEGVVQNQTFNILSIASDLAGSKKYQVSGFIAADVPLSSSGFSRIKDVPGTNPYVVTIPQGLYDLAGLNKAIARELEELGAKTDPDPLITLSPDDATQKVEIRFNYDDVVIDFTQPNTFKDILGFEGVVGPFPDAPVSITAQEVAGFNTIDSFLLHSDLTNKGIRYNNQYNQTIAQVQIDTSPGSQIVYKPFNPTKINAQELAGVNRTNIRFWLTDQSNNRVNTNGEFFTILIKLSWSSPVIMEM